MSCYVVSKLDNERGIQENPKISFKLEELDDSSWTHWRGGLFTQLNL